MGDGGPTPFFLLTSSFFLSPEMGDGGFDLSMGLSSLGAEMGDGRWEMGVQLLSSFFLLTSPGGRSLKSEGEEGEEPG